jgi:hypothetical protein
MFNTSRNCDKGNTTSPPITWRCISCSPNSKDVTTPKLPPPPRTAQYRSGSRWRWRAAAAVGGNDVDRLHVVQRQAESPRQAPKPPPRVSPPTPVCETVPAVVTRPERHAFVVESPSRLPPATCGRLRRKVHAGVAHRRQVDLQAAVTGRFAAVAVAAALDRQQQVALAGEGDGVHDVRRAGRLHDQRRVLVDARVQDPASDVIALEAGQQQAPAQGLRQLLERRLFQRHLGAAAGNGTDVATDFGQRRERGGQRLAGRQARRRQRRRRTIAESGGVSS